MPSAPIQNEQVAKHIEKCMPSVKSINDLGCTVINKISHPVRLLVSGRSTLGKTTLAVDIITKRLLRGVNRCFAVCPTFYSQDTLSRLRQVKGAFTKDTVFTEVHEGVFRYIFDECTKNPAPTLLFVDDAAADKATHGNNKGAFAKLCIASPHLNLSIVGCFQKLVTASPSFRYNSEALISFEPTGMEDVDRIIEEFNPCPSHPDSKLITRLALTEAWKKDRFTFIFRERFSLTCPNPKVRFHAGFKREINFHV